MPALPGWPLLHLVRCTGPELDRGQTTSKLSARQLKVVWSGTARSRPSRAIMEPISPSVCRSAGRIPTSASAPSRSRSRSPIARLSVARGSPLGLPGRACSVGKQDREAVALAQSCIVDRRIHRPVPLLGDGLATLGIGFGWHGFIPESNEHQTPHYLTSTNAAPD
jgi:hypothetical protein